MNVLRAETAGFCMGVQLALNKLDSLIANNADDVPIYTLGPIIHNPQVLEDYKQKKVVVADTPEEIPDGASVVIRAHGVPKQLENRLKERGVHIVDATCPKVKKAQVLIARQSAQGRALLLFGEESHPEVKGLLSYADNGAFVFGEPEMLDTFPFRDNESYCLAAQTTQDRAAFEVMAEELQARGDLDLAVLNTICDATRLRQSEAQQIAQKVDFMLVAGGHNSGNTRRLVQVVRDRGIECMHVETVDDVPLTELTKHSCIGLTAGASTPKDIIDAIQEALENL